VAAAYWQDHPRRHELTLSAPDRASLIKQATQVVLSNGEAALGLHGGPFWSGEQCLQRLGTQRRGRVA